MGTRYRDVVATCYLLLDLVDTRTSVADCRKSGQVPRQNDAVRRSAYFPVTLTSPNRTQGKRVLLEGSCMLLSMPTTFLNRS